MAAAPVCYQFLFSVVMIRLPSIISFLFRPPILRHDTVHVTAVLFALPYESTHDTEQWLTLLLHIPEVRVSSISRQTGDTDWLSWLSSAPPGQYTSYQAMSGFFHVRSWSLFTDHPAI